MNTNFVEQLRKAVLDHTEWQIAHESAVADYIQRYYDLEGSKRHTDYLEKKGQELEQAKAVAMREIAVIATEFERYLARGYQVDGSFLHTDRELLPLLNHDELKAMDKKHAGNTTMSRYIRAEAEKRNLSMNPVVPREHRQSGFDFVAKMAKAAIADARTPTRAAFVDDAVWPTAWDSHKQAANVDDFAAHFGRWDSANLLKIPPQFDAA